MRFAGFEIKRASRVAELEKKVDALAAQAVTVRDMSQLVAQLTQGAQSAGAPANQIPFGPLTPLAPLGNAQEQSQGPRRWDYPVGVNVQYMPRTGEAVSFAALRNFARLYDVARICIQANKDDISTLALTFRAREKGTEDKYAALIAKLDAFWKKPDRRALFSDWLGQVLEDVFVTDATALHLQTTRGGELYAVRYVDGATMHPVVDDAGEIFGYQQIIKGVPRTGYIDPDYENALPDRDTLKNIFPLSYLVYRPRVLMPDSIYGFPPLEWIILTINQALRKQTSDLLHFTEGNIPEALAAMPPGTGIEQALQFNDDFNALLAGDPRMRARLHFLPGDIDPTKIHEFRPFTVDTEWDEMLVIKTCAALKRTPQSIGFMNRTNRATAETQENAQQGGLQPIIQYVESLIDDINANWFGADMLEAKLVAREIAEDEYRNAQTDEIYLRNGVKSIDEVRSARAFGVPFGLDKPFLMSAGGMVPLTAGVLANAESEHDGTDERTDNGTGATDEIGNGSAGIDRGAAAGRGAVVSENASGELANHADDGAGETGGRAHRSNGAASDAATKAIGQWRENALKRFRQGREPKINFESTAIPAAVRAAIVERLIYLDHNTANASDVRKVFADALELVKKNKRRTEPDRAARTQFEQRAAGVIRDAYAAQAKRLAAQWRDGVNRRKSYDATHLVKKESDDELAAYLKSILDWGEESDELAQMVLPLYEDMMQAAWREGAAYLDIKTDWDKVNANVLKLARARAQWFATQSTDTSKAALYAVLQDWIATGGTMPELLDRVAQVWTGARADVAAVTEVTALFAEGNKAAWQQSDVVRAYRWRTAFDDIVCEICAPLDEQEFDFDAAEIPPGHPNCRCWIVPVVKDIGAD